MRNSSAHVAARRLALSAIGQLSADNVYRYYRWRNSWRPELWRESPFFLIHIPKTAGSSIASSVGLVDPGHILMSDIVIELREKLVAKPCLAIVRDPAARLVSTFNYVHSMRASGRPDLVNTLPIGKSIDDFIFRFLVTPRYKGHYFFRPAHDYISDAQFLGAKVKVVGFDNLVTEVPIFMKCCGLSGEALPHERATQFHKAAVVDIGVEAMAIVREIYEKDYDLIEALK